MRLSRALAEAPGEPGSVRESGAQTKGQGLQRAACELPMLFPSCRANCSSKNSFNDFIKSCSGDIREQNWLTPTAWCGPDQNISKKNLGKWLPTVDQTLVLDVTPQFTLEPRKALV